LHIAAQLQSGVRTLDAHAEKILNHGGMVFIDASGKIEYGKEVVPLAVIRDLFSKESEQVNFYTNKSTDDLRPETDKQ
jgi:hypothetical protein